MAVRKPKAKSRRDRLAKELRWVTRQRLAETFKDPAKGDKQKFPVLASAVPKIAEKVRPGIWEVDPAGALIIAVGLAISELPEGYPEIKGAGWRSLISWRDIGVILCGLHENLPPKIDSPPYDYDDYVDVVKRRSDFINAPNQDNFTRYVSHPYRLLLAGKLLDLAEGRLPIKIAAASSNVSMKPLKEFILDDGMPYVHRVEYERQFADHYEAGSRVFLLNGGIGRTTLARYLAYRYADTAAANQQIATPLRNLSDSVVLINAENPDTLQADLVRALYRHGIDVPTHEVLIHEVFRELLASDKAPGLVHIDWMRKWSEVADLIPRTPRCAIILTPKAGLQPPKGAIAIWVDSGMTQEEAKELVRNHLPRLNDDEVGKVVTHIRSSLSPDFIIGCCNYLKHARLDYFLSRNAMETMRYG